jgi:hypothetical protein
MSERSPLNPRVCFALPEGVLPLPLEEIDLFEHFEASGAGDDRMEGKDGHRDFLTGLSTKGVEALSRLVPTLMCGEESAVHVFNREARRVEDNAFAASCLLMSQIASEELLHERLLSLLHACLPTPADFHAVRRRARYFFVRLANPDPATHFARIVGLDSAVCIILTSLLHPTAAMASAPLVYRIWSRISRDEARHVRTARQHVIDLGFEKNHLIEEGRRVRKDFATEMVVPLGDVWDNMGVDPDRLVRRIIGTDSD